MQRVAIQSFFRRQWVRTIIADENRMLRRRDQELNKLHNMVFGRKRKDQKEKALEMLMNETEIEKSHKSLHRLVNRLGDDVDTRTLSYGARRLLIRMQEACDRADELENEAKCTDDVKLRADLMKKRIRDCGKALGEVLVDAAKLGSVEAVRKIFNAYDARFKPTAFHYNALLGMCLKSRSALLAEMRQKNVAPDIRTYTLVFASCTSKTEFQILMEEVSAAGFPVDLKACYAILNAMIRSNCDAFEILRTFDDLRDKWKIQPDKKMLQQLIKVHKAKGIPSSLQEQQRRQLGRMQPLLKTLKDQAQLEAMNLNRKAERRDALM
ncbi:unnamed protein product (mitochondrion) [Plasmodiophora brassicae]|uniref:Pentacotripeptide-repeat region of PRORP domain-containing protein n=1 Tax=Plasmodiophora brassicae TaxID=37360 RepID=A0A3P3XZK1_PLABS|nr:unnamed protein product [Plasmodiophora brassicae]